MCSGIRPTSSVAILAQAYQRLAFFLRRRAYSELRQFILAREVHRIYPLSGDGVDGDLAVIFYFKEDLYAQRCTIGTLKGA